MVLATCEPFETLLAERQMVTCLQIQPGDPWAIMYTSGTTGPSKGVMLSHQFVASQTASIAASSNMRRKMHSRMYSLLGLVRQSA